jgi:dephospho-CoA kinase
MIRIGLTGSIGMGKSAVSAMFAACGVPVFDADAEVHRLQGPGGALVSRIEAAFPGSAGPNGIDRQKLGSMVLGNPAALRQLEQIIHPAVYRARQDFLRHNRSRKMVVLDIPLLFEKAKRRASSRTGHAQADVIVTVSAPLWIQKKRVLKRPGMSPLRLQRIRALQVPDHIKRRLSDHVIETGRLKHQTRRAVVRLIACLGAKKRG